MTTMADLVRDVRSRLSGTLTDELNVLDADYAAAQGRITLKYDARGLAPGTVVSCEENTWYAYSVDSGASRQIVVAPSFDGGPDLPKVTGKQVRLNPRVTDWSIFTHLRDQIALMSAPTHGLGQVDFWMDSGTATTTGTYEPPTGVVPSRIRAVYNYDGQKWWPMRGGWGWQLGAVRVFDDRWAGYCFVYEQPFVRPTLFADDIETTLGLNLAMADIPVLGACGMLMQTMESRRQNLGSQGDPRRAQEVQAGSNMGSGREYLRLRDARIADESRRSLNIAAMTGLAL